MWMRFFLHIWYSFHKDELPKGEFLDRLGDFVAPLKVYVNVCMCAKEWLPGKIQIFHHIGRVEKNGILEKSREGEEISE